MPKAPGQSTWQSDAPKAESRAQAFFHAPNSGSSMDFDRRWGGDAETSLPTINALFGAGQQALTQYVVTRAALGPTENTIENAVEEGASRLGPPQTGSAVPLGLNAGARPMPGPAAPLALNAAPSVIPMGPGVDAGRPRFPAMGARGPRETTDARKAGPGGMLSYPSAPPIDPAGQRRKGTGGNDRRLKGLIERQMNDRM